MFFYSDSQVYTMQAVAFDQNMLLAGSLSVPVNDFPCELLPEVKILEGTRISNGGKAYYKSLQLVSMAESAYNCSVTPTVT